MAKNDKTGLICGWQFLTCFCISSLVCLLHGIFYHLYRLLMTNKHTHNVTQTFMIAFLIT